ncbi:hemagglutinin/amebocyte aggregation factor-like [Oculina patagonica]
MAKRMLVKLLFLLMLSEVLLFSATEAKPWWRRRRRRSAPACSSSRPAGTWHNSWHQHFKKYCSSGYSMYKWKSHHRNCKEDRIHYFMCKRAPFHGSCTWGNHWQNKLDQPLTFECPQYGFISGIESKFSWPARDRWFDFRCCHRHGYATHSCYWTKYVNNWDQDVDYSVPYPYHLVGVHSYHYNKAEDRRWRFKICRFYKYSGK